MCVHGEAGGIEEFRIGSRSAVAGMANESVACHGGDDARGVVHLAHAVALAVGEEDVAGGVYRHGKGVVYIGWLPDRRCRRNWRNRLRRRW